VFQGLYRWLSERPLTILAVVALLSAGALAVCFDFAEMRPRFAIDASVERLLPPADEDRAVLEKARAQFGDADTLLVAVNLGDVLTEGGLSKVSRITADLRAMPGVRGVLSLDTAPNLIAEGDTVEVSSFTAQARQDPRRIDDFAAQIAGNPLYRDLLVTSDGRIAVFVLQIDDIETAEFRKRDYPGLIRAISAGAAPGAEVWITGSGLVRAATAAALDDALAFTVPAVFAVIGVLLFATFRSLRATLAAILTVAIALLWTMAMSVILHIPMNLVTTITPALVITIGLSYTVHLLAAYFFSREIRAEERNRRKSAAQKLWRRVAGFLAGTDPDRLHGPDHVAWVMNRIATGLTLSAATTIVGFLALLLNPLTAVKQFAVLSTFGTLFTGALTLVFLPSLLAVIGTSERRRPAGEKWFTRAAAWLAAFDIRWRGWIIAAAVLLIPLDLYFANKVRTGTEFIQSFDKDAEVRRDFEAINLAINGANSIAILVETFVDDALTDPGRVGEIERLSQWLREQKEVGGVVSFVDQLKLINQSLNENDPAFHAVPDDAVAIKQLMVFGGGDELKRVIDARFRTALISLRINVDDSVEIGDLISRIEDRLAALPPPLTARGTGNGAIAPRTVNELASGHLESILLATVAIWLMLSVMFTSWRAGFMATLPNLIPVLTYFAALGVMDITLNPTTSLIACIVLGIAVNDTVHFLARFNADARELADEKKALRTALGAVLRPITLATVALCLGFLCFAGSDLRTQVQFGALASFTLAVAWLADITLTPALGSKLRIVTLWDLLRLDLGQSPQHTIPLFNGLSARQARVFALLSKMESVAEGARVIKEGDLARDMFVVVDGTLEVWLERDGERRTLNTMSRGAVIGETGYFGQRRTANVDAKTATRLLRFDSQDLERLRVRYPKIAATLYRNLNRVQAERIARMTAMVS
jgi:uncharacterized protein